LILSFIFEPLFRAFERDGERLRNQSAFHDCSAFANILFSFYILFVIFFGHIWINVLSFSSGVQVFFHSPVGFINSFNIVGGNLENSVMQNCQYYAVGVSSTVDFVNNRSCNNSFSLFLYSINSNLFYYNSCHFVETKCQSN
jgi:predicted PurR-regulated permease PerM